MSYHDVYKNPNQKSPKAIDPYKRKSQKRLSLFFGKQDNHKNTHEDPGMFSKQNISHMKTQGTFRTIHTHLEQFHPILLKFILILGFPFFMLGIVIMFFVALICIFFIGIYIAITQSIRQLGCFLAIILLPGAIIVGGIGATLFPWVFKRYIMQIHYGFWFQFTQEYFKELCSICC